MATTDTNVPQVIVNKLTSAEYATATKSPTEFYAVTDGQIETADIANGAITTAKIANGAVTSQNIDWTTFLDIIYPVGSYYETSDTSFNPNTAWGGTWVEDTSGRVLVSKTSSGALSTVGSTGGNTTHAHDFKVGMAAFYGSAICGENSDWEHWGAWSYAQNKYAKSYGFEGLYNTNRNNALQTAVAAASEQTRYTAGDTTSESSYQPYLVVKRWHRTA